MDTTLDTTELPPNDRDRLGVPSWRWWVLFAVLAALILAGMFGCLPRPTGKNYLDVAAVVVGVAVAVYCLSWTHALLPSPAHKTICNITGVIRRSISWPTSQRTR
jgi:hypothetical protein